MPVHDVTQIERTCREGRRSCHYRARPQFRWWDSLTLRTELEHFSEWLYQVPVQATRVAQLGSGTGSG